MTKPLKSQSQKRFNESLSSLFRGNDDKNPFHSASVVFIKSSSDTGVIRNGGRNGARFAPQSLLSYFKKLTQDKQTAGVSFAEVEVSNIDEEKKDFEKAQTLEAQKIQTILKASQQGHIIHIGGGHDHIFPLLKASADHKKIIVLNIDAHADTRDDQEANSGTPFRQFAHEFKGEFHLFQIGLHAFANSASTLADLPRSQSILWRKELLIPEKVESFFESIKSIMGPDAQVIFSLDADARSAHLIPGVSAVNADGLSLLELEELWDRYRNLIQGQRPILGIYELNPVYDSLSGLSMRTIAAFIFRTLKAR